MTYQRAREIIAQHQPFGKKPGLQVMQQVMGRLGNPEKELPVLHVAGTNGKGTTCTYLASVLQQAGYKVGLFTSPYVVDFRERFQINGQMIDQADLCACAERVHALPEAAGLTEFGFITALAFCWFAQAHCDVVVLEVGLGGKSDPTNVIPCPVLGVITAISLDHTGILGKSLGEIAGEKAGIIKPGGTIIAYPYQDPQVDRVLENTCAQQGAALLPSSKEIVVQQESLQGSRAIIGGRVITIAFSGYHQLCNAATALTAIDALRDKGWSIGEAHIQRGMALARIPARMELLRQSPPVILDGGHNPGCGQALKALLQKHLNGKKLCGIIGMTSDKDSASYLQLVAPLFTRLYCVRLQNPRALSAADLCAAARPYCKDSMAVASVKEATDLALAAKADGVVVCGSLFLAGEIRPILLEQVSAL